MNPKLTLPVHQLKMAQQLDRVSRGDLDRLMLCLPPRHGKSTLGSIYGPAQFIGLYPDKNIVIVCNTEQLAKDWGQEVRNIVRSNRFRDVFPHVSLMPDSQAKGRWRTMQGGGFYALGIDGTIMGRGADILIVDDPYKSYTEAQDENVRKKVLDSFTNNFLNRMEPGGRIILINHRMAEDDLCGSLLEMMERDPMAEQWEVVEFPAINEQGVALWPERHTVERLKRLKHSMNPLSFEALFQQNPAPADGKHFKAHWFQEYNWADGRRPPLSIFAAADFAVTEAGQVGNPNPDYTEIGIFGVDPDHNVYALDWWSGQHEPDVWINQLVAMLKQWRPRLMTAESGVIKNATEAAITRAMMEARVYTPLHWVSAVRDKVSRSTAIQGRMAHFKVWFPKTDWAHRTKMQMLKFPGGKFDDAVDVMSLAGNILPLVAPPQRQETRPTADRIVEMISKPNTLNDLWEFQQSFESSEIYSYEDML